MSKIELCNYHQEINVGGVKFTAYNAGHVLGAAMFMVEIEGVRVLYTGDYSRHEDRHLLRAELPPVSPDVLIVVRMLPKVSSLTEQESTYGVAEHEERVQREKQFVCACMCWLRCAHLPEIG